MPIISADIKTKIAYGQLNLTDTIQVLRKPMYPFIDDKNIENPLVITEWYYDDMKSHQIYKSKENVDKMVNSALDCLKYGFLKVRPHLQQMTVSECLNEL